MKTLTLASLGLFVWLGTAQGQQGWRLEGGWEPWKLVGGEQVKKREDFSGLASLTAGHGVLVSNESRGLCLIHLDAAKQTVKIESLVALLPGKGDEMDLEAVTASPTDQCYYAACSHSVARKARALHQDRRMVFKVPVDGSGRGVRESRMQSSSLAPLIATDPDLAPALGVSTKEGGLDIEGMAERAGVLFFGLRAPLIEGQAVVLEVPAAALFANPEKATATKHRLDLGGVGHGIRELAALQDGYLILAGPSGDNDSASGFALHGWKGPGGTPVKLLDLPPSPGKAEGMMVLSETAEQVTLLFVFDGVEDGAPAVLKILKPKP
jgi:hypothetical protein